MNPLSLPQWGKKKKIGDLPKANNYLGVKTEAVREDAEAEFHVSIMVRGVKSVPSGSYKVAFVPGQQLGKYLSRLKLKHAAIYSAVYDTVHGGNRRLRMAYIPQAGSQITIGISAAGPATHLQRSTVDAQRVAAKMGGRGGTVKVVERKL